MAHMANAGRDELQLAVELYKRFLFHSDGRDEMSKKAMMDQFVQWTAKWLLEVRHIVSNEPGTVGTQGGWWERLGNTHTHTCTCMHPQTRTERERERGESRGRQRKE